MTELHTCLWLWSAHGKHTKSEGNKKYPPSDTTRFINADHSAAILEPFTASARRHTLSFQSPHFPSAPTAQSLENEPICGSAGVLTVDSSTTNSQLNWRLDRWCAPQVHLKSNERKVECDYTHKAVYHRWPWGKLRKWEEECESCKDEVEQEGKREGKKKGNRGKSTLDTLT